MSQQNVKTVRDVFERWAAGDWIAALGSWSTGAWPLQSG